MADDVETAQRDKPLDIGERADVKTRNKAIGARERELRETVAAIMSHKNGRSFMWWLLSECHIFQTSFSSNGLTMAFKDGERNAGLLVLALVNRACPERYVEMMKENTEASYG